MKQLCLSACRPAAVFIYFGNKNGNRTREVTPNYRISYLDLWGRFSAKLKVWLSLRSPYPAGFEPATSLLDRFTFKLNGYLPAIQMGFEPKSVPVVREGVEPP